MHAELLFFRSKGVRRRKETRKTYAGSVEKEESEVVSPGVLSILHGGDAR